MVCIDNNTEGAEILMDYCAGILDPIRAAELETHFHECARCKMLADAQRKTWAVLDLWNPVDVSPDFDAKLYGRIAAEAREPLWRRLLRPAGSGWLWKPLFPLAAAGMVLALAFLMRAPEANTPPASSSVERIDLQQVEQALDDMDLLTPVGQASSSVL
jgi:hypothetical protein